MPLPLAFGLLALIHSGSEPLFSIAIGPAGHERFSTHLCENKMPVWPASECICLLAEAGRGWRPPRARSGAGGACWGAHWPTPLGGWSPHSYPPHAEVDAEFAVVEELAQRLPQSVGGRSGLGLGLGSGLETGLGFGLVPAPLHRTAGSACCACCPQRSSCRRASSQGCPPSCGGG